MISSAIFRDFFTLIFLLEQPLRSQAAAQRRFLRLSAPWVFRRRNTDAAENAGVFPKEPFAGRGLLAQLHGPRRICTRRFKEHTQIAWLQILWSGVCEHVQRVRHLRLIPVFRRRAFKICKRQIGLAAQSVAQKLAVIRRQGLRAAQRFIAAAPASLFRSNSASAHRNRAQMRSGCRPSAASSSNSGRFSGIF